MLDQEPMEGVSIRPHLPYGPEGTPTGVIEEAPMELAVPLSEIVVPVELDPLTAAEDVNFVPRLKAQRNLPAPIKDRLDTLF